MREGDDLLHSTPHKLPGLLLQGLGNRIDTAYGRDNPDLVADTGPAVCPTEAVKVRMLCLLQPGSHRLILIGQKVTQGSL